MADELVIIGEPEALAALRTLEGQTVPANRL